MRTRCLLPFILAISLAVPAPAWARSSEPSPGPQESQLFETPQESQLIEHGHYLNKRGEEVHSPAHSKSGAKPDGATAKCRDGTYSFSHSHRGTCSRHGGVDEWE